MITAYGAPPTSFRPVKSYDYLYAIDGNGARPTNDSSSDDESQPPQQALRCRKRQKVFPRWSSLLTPRTVKPRCAAALVVFRQNCAGCHGDDGRGDGLPVKRCCPNQQI